MTLMYTFIVYIFHVIILPVLKSRRLRWTGHLAYIIQIRNALRMKLYKFARRGQFAYSSLEFRV
jgi:hypothetical protein